MAETSSDLMLEHLNELKRTASALDKAIEYAVAVSLSAVATPKGTEINALSKLNPRSPVYFGIIREYEKRLNELLGRLKSTGKPLCKPMSFFSGAIETYMDITPSTGLSEMNRAEAVLQTISQGRALQRVPEGVRMPFAPDEQEVPESTGRFK